MYLKKKKEQTFLVLYKFAAPAAFLLLFVFCFLHNLLGAMHCCLGRAGSKCCVCAALFYLPHFNSEAARAAVAKGSALFQFPFFFSIVIIQERQQPCRKVSMNLLIIFHGLTQQLWACVLLIFIPYGVNYRLCLSLICTLHD